MNSCLVPRTSSLLLFAILAFTLSAETFKSHDGTVLHYDVVGKGTPVLLLSGGPGFWPDYMRPIADRLSGKYKFILLHQRGTGKSTDASNMQMPKLVADVEAMRRELGVEQLIVAGHSFGGILSMMYAREHPERIAALALINSGGPTLRSVVKLNQNLEARFTDDDKARIKEWTARAKDEKAKAVLEITKAKTPAYFADRANAKLLTDSMDESSFRDTVFWAIVAQMMALDIRSGLEKVKAPVLVIHGKQDPLESAEEVHETFPGSRLELLDNAGHFPWFEQPERFYKVLDGFLAQVAESCH